MWPWQVGRPPLQTCTPVCRRRAAPRGRLACSALIPLLTLPRCPMYFCRSTATDIGNEGSLKEVAQRIRDMGRRAVEVKVDVRHRASVDAAVDEAVAALGLLDVLVTSAGGCLLYGGPANPLGRPCPPLCLQLCACTLTYLSARLLLGQLGCGQPKPFITAPALLLPQPLFGDGPWCLVYLLPLNCDICCLAGIMGKLHAAHQVTHRWG